MKTFCTFALTILLCGCAGAAEKTAPEKDAWKNKVFTAEELKNYNGRNGQPVYVAVDGIVYDLSRSKYWKTGTHMKMHEAGADQSRAIHELAPQTIHKGGKILNKMPKVGVTEDYAKKNPAATAEKGKTGGAGKGKK